MYMLAGTWLISVPGCARNDPLPLAPVSGTVTYQGKPLDHGRVVFAPLRGTPGPAAVGEIRPDGSFQMHTCGRDGAAIGQHRGTVHCRKILTPAEAASLVIPASLIPDKYGHEAHSALSFEVRPGENHYAIALD